MLHLKTQPEPVKSLTEGGGGGGGECRATEIYREGNKVRI